MKQAGLAGEFLAENEPTAPAEGQPTPAAAPVPTGPSSAETTANAQKRANIVLAVLFLAGMALVYFMSTHDKTTQADPMAAASETIVDHAVKQFRTSPASITGDGGDAPEVSPVELAREMISGTSKRQVPLKELKSNPFVLVPARQSQPEKPKETVPAGPTPDATAVQRAETLQLQSIVITNERALAIISDRLLTVGQEVAGWSVDKIGDGQVILRRGDLTYVLKEKR